MAYKGKDTLDIMNSAINYNNALINLYLKYLCKNSIKIVDFGAGIGTLTDILRKKGFEIECVEKDEILKSILENKYFKTYDSISFYPDNSLYNIVSFNVLEHVENDIEVLKEINKKLNKDGIFFLFLPANSYLFSSFDKKLGHFRRYDKPELENILNKCNFKIKTIFYFDCIGFLFAHIYKLFNRNGKISQKQIILYDKFIFPLSKLMDNIFHNIMGKNIAAVLTKENND